MLEAGEDFVTIKETIGEDGEPNLSLTMDRKKLLTVGHPAIKKFLEKLQVGAGRVFWSSSYSTKPGCWYFLIILRPKLPSSKFL